MLLTLSRNLKGRPVSSLCFTLARLTLSFLTLCPLSLARLQDLLSLVPPLMLLTLFEDLKPETGVYYPTPGPDAAGGAAAGGQDDAAGRLMQAADLALGVKATVQVRSCCAALCCALLPQWTSPSATPSAECRVSEVPVCCTSLALPLLLL